MINYFEFEKIRKGKLKNKFALLTTISAGIIFALVLIISRCSFVHKNEQVALIDHQYISHNINDDSFVDSREIINQMFFFESE